MTESTIGLIAREILLIIFDKVFMIRTVRLRMAKKVPS